MRFILKIKKSSKILCLFWFFLAFSKCQDDVQKSNGVQETDGVQENDGVKNNDVQKKFDDGDVDNGQDKEMISDDLDENENPLGGISTDLFADKPRSKTEISDPFKLKSDDGDGDEDDDQDKEKISDDLDEKKNPLGGISTDLFADKPRSKTEISDPLKLKSDNGGGDEDDDQDKEKISDDLDEKENPLGGISTDLSEDNPRSKTEISDPDKLKYNNDDGEVNNGQDKEKISDDLDENENPLGGISTDLFEEGPKSGTKSSNKPIIDEKDDEEKTLNNSQDDNTIPPGDNQKTIVDDNMDKKKENSPITYKNYSSYDEYLKEKEQRKDCFEIKKPTEARFFCTIWDKLPYIYKRIKKRFVGDLCHAIVLGTPLIIKKSRVVIPEDKSKQLKDIYDLKTKGTLLMVIMKHSSYEEWSSVLQNVKKEVDILIKFIKKYKIDGIQFSNLQPTAQEQWDAEMLCKILKFFNLLIKTTKLKGIPDFKIGLTISAYSQSISTSFQSFKDLNKIVYWYSINTISMIKCTPAYLTGTSPLDGEISLKRSLKTLIEKTNIEKTKIVVSIQLYPNKLNTYQHSSYIEMCQSKPKTWKRWCAARPEHFRLKGQYLRNLSIWGIQLYYMDSDDYKSKCKCYSFPMIRALLRGLINMDEPEYCSFLGEVENQPAACTIPKI